MPSYINNTSDVITVGSVRFEPGQTVTTTSYIVDLPAGVTLVSSASTFNPILLSQEITTTTTVTIPAAVKGCDIVIACLNGSATIKFNGSAFSPVKLLQGGEGIQLAVTDRSVDSIIVTCTGVGVSGNLVKVDIYELGTVKDLKFGVSNVSVNVGDIEIGAVEIKDSASDIRTTVSTIGAKGALATQILDASGNQITSFGSPSTIAEYISPSDFTVTYTSTSTVTLSGMPFTVTTGAQIVYLRVRNSSTNLTTVYVNGAGGYAFSHSSGVVTAYKDGVATTIFTANDMYEMGINGPDKAFDSSTNSLMTSSLKNTWNQYTDVETIISAANIQELDTTPTDLGSEIDMRGYNQLGIWLTVDINTSTAVKLRILHKHTSAGTEEYREIYLGNPASNLTTLNLNDYLVASDADQLLKINVPVSATSPFIQLQVYDAADGTGQIEAAYITKAYAA